LYIEFME